MNHTAAKAIAAIGIVGTGIFTIVGGVAAARWRDRLAGHGRQ